MCHGHCKKRNGSAVVHSGAGSAENLSAFKTTESITLSDCQSCAQLDWQEDLSLYLELKQQQPHTLSLLLTAAIWERWMCSDINQLFLSPCFWNPEERIYYKYQYIYSPQSKKLNLETSYIPNFKKEKTETGRKTPFEWRALLMPIWYLDKLFKFMYCCNHQWYIHFSNCIFMTIHPKLSLGFIPWSFKNVGMSTEIVVNFNPCTIESILTVRLTFNHPLLCLLDTSMF